MVLDPMQAACAREQPTRHMLGWTAMGSWLVNAPLDRIRLTSLERSACLK